MSDLQIALLIADSYISYLSYNELIMNDWCIRCIQYWICLRFTQCLINLDQFLHKMLSILKQTHHRSISILSNLLTHSKRLIIHPAPSLILHTIHKYKLSNYFSTIGRQPNAAQLSLLSQISQEAQQSFAKGQYAQARQAQKKAADLLLKTRGENSEQYSRIINNIGITYKLQRQMPQAITYIQKSISILSKLEGDYSLQKALTQGELGQIYFMIKEHAKAYPHLLECSEVLLKKQLNTIELVAILEMLASIQMEKGNFAAATASYEKSLSILEIIKGTENLDMTGNLSALANCYIKLGRFNEAVELYQKLQLMEGAKNGETLKLASAIINKALALRMSKKIDECCEQFQKGISLVENIQGKQHSDLTPLLQNLGMLYFEHNKHQKALPHLQRFLSITEMTKGISNLNYATILAVIGHIKKKEKDYSSAIDCYNRALKTFQADSSATFFVASVLNYMGETFFLQKKFDSSLTHFEESLRILSKINDKQTPQKRAIRSNIAAIHEAMQKSQSPSTKSQANSDHKK